jgi:aminopeptidase YwaD
LSQADWRILLHMSTRRLLLTTLFVCAALPAWFGLSTLSSQSVSGTAAQITQDSILGHLEFLASDALQGRGSGTRDEEIAATYIGAYFRRLGLEPMADTGGFVQRIDVIRESASAPPTVSAGDRRWTHGTGLLVTSLAGARTSGPLHHFTEGGTAPPGAVVLMPPPPAGAPAGSRAGGPAVAVPPGAAAVLVLASPQAMNSWAATAGRPVAAGTRVGGVTGAALRAARVTLDAETHAAFAALPSGTPVTIDATLTGTTSSTWNAMARLTGVDVAQRAEVIVLGAHLDHLGRRETAAGEDKIFNGADDDASGTVAVMELAGALAAGPRPKRTIVFALFGSEEAGGFGAGYFVDKPVVAHDAMIAQIQFEMLGRADSLVPADHLWLTGYERSNLGSELAKRGARLVQDPRPDQSFFTRSDNIRFARKGIVAHTVSSFNLHKDYHQAGDEVSKIDLAHMTRSIQSMLDPIRWLADSTFTPAWAPGGRPQ